MNDEWFADEEKVRRLVGLLECPVPLPDAREVINPLGSYIVFSTCKFLLQANLMVTLCLVY